MRFEAFLTRADDEALQELLGVKVLRLLRAMDEGSLTTERKRELLLEQARPQTLLAQRSSRRILLELLRPDEATRLCRVFGLPTARPYESLAKLGYSADELLGLFDFFELAPLIEEAKEPEPSSQNVRPSYPLFAHQDVAARRCIEALHTGNRRLLLHMPTGAGKTRTAMNIIAEELRRKPRRGVIWLAHSEELCEQAASEFAKAWSALGSREVSVHRFWGAHAPDLDDIRGDFVVASLSKAFAVARRSIGRIGRLGAQAGLVVLDEAHQAVAPTYRLLLDALVEPVPDSSLLGLSATPGRTWNDPGVDRELARFFGRRKVTLEVEGYDNPVEYLIAEGYLARPVFQPLPIARGVELTKSERDRLSADLDIPATVLERLAQAELRNLAILAEIERLARRHRRIIVFAATVEHSNLIAYALRSRGLWARSVSGATGATDRQAALESFKDDDQGTKVLCNYGVLTTGFDAPRTSAAVIARPTASLVLYSQMVGRATRGPRAGGNATAEIVTVVDSGLPGFGDLGDAFLNWEDVWGEG